jgi:hypothetical protein
MDGEGGDQLSDLLVKIGSMGNTYNEEAAWRAQILGVSRPVG